MQDNDDIQIHTYQDDLTTDDTAVDPIINEETDDPVEGFGVPAGEFKAELDKLDIDTGDQNIASKDPDDLAEQDDEETFVESLDEDPDEQSGNT